MLGDLSARCFQQAPTLVFSTWRVRFSYVCSQRAGKIQPWRSLQSL